MKKRGKKLIAILTAACVCLGTPASVFAGAAEDSVIIEDSNVDLDTDTYLSDKSEVKAGEESADWKQVDNNAAEIRFNGSWEVETGTNHFGGDAKQTNKPGASAEFTFTGTGIRWRGQMDSNYGSAKIFIDGELIDTPSAYAGSGNPMQADVYTLIGLPNGEHTFKLEAVGPQVQYQNFIELDLLEYTEDTTPVVPDVLEATPESIILKPGRESTISAKVLKGNSHVYKSTMTAESSNPAVATVDADFKVKAIGAGTAVIKLMAGTLKKEIPVNVSEKAALRMQIDNEHPLIIHHMARELNPTNPATPGPIQGGHDIVTFWSQIPENQKPYSAIVIHPGFYLNTSYQGHMAFLEEQIKVANDNKIPFFVMIGNSFTSEYLTTEKMAEYYQKYPYCMGSAYSELHSAKDRNGLSNEMADKIELASQYGGYVWIADMNDENDSVEVLVNQERFYNTAKENKENVILMSKTTSAWSTNVSYNSFESVTYGAWLSDICGNYGSLIDSWMWFIEGYWKLYEDPNGNIGSHGPEECRGAFAFPELLYPMRMIQESMSGATVYSFEHPFNSTGIRNQIGPVFNHAISKAIDYMLNEKIPTKEEMLAKTKVAYDSSEGSLSNFAGSKGFNIVGSLYGDGGKSGDERAFMTQTSGRYGIVPSILPRAAQEFKEKNKDILMLKKSDISSSYNSAEKLKEFFDSKYPETYTGTGYAYKLDNMWYAYNSKWQKEQRQQVSLPLEGGSKADISFDNYTYVLLKEEKNDYTIQLNNFLVDKDDIWEGYIATGPGETQHWDSDNNDLWPKYLLNNYMPDGVRRDETYRNTTIILTEQDQRPVVEVTSGMYDSGNQHNQFDDPVVSYDETTKEAKISIDSNGWVNLVVKKGTPEVIVDKKALDEQIIEAEALDKGKYTEDTWRVLEEALTAAREIQKDEKATQEEVNKGTDRLKAAIQGLKAKPAIVDKKALGEQIIGAEALDKGKYTEDTWRVLEEALTAAREIQKDEKATQEEVNKGTDRLKAAIQGLKAKPTQGELDLAEAKLVITKISALSNITLKSETAVKAAWAAYNRLTDAQKKLVTNYKVLVGAQNQLDTLKFQNMKVSAKAVTSDSKNILLSWKKVNDANGYVVMVKNGSKWKVVKTIANNRTLSYKYTKTTAGSKYTFAVKAYKSIGGKNVDTSFASVTKKAVPQAPDAKVKVNKGYVKLTWKKVSGATSYLVKRKDGRKWKKAGTMKAKTSFYKDTKVKKGKKYSYKICAYRKNGKKNIIGSYSKTFTIKAK